MLRESQRLSPPTTLGLKRLFREPYTFQNGLHVEAGQYVCLPIFAIENDPELIPNPKEFDGLRHYRLAAEAKIKNSAHGFVASSKSSLVNRANADADDFQFSTPSPMALSFGYGRAACPGRHFASLVIKMVFVKMLSEYEFRFVPEIGRDGKERAGKRPANYMIHEFLFPWPWDWMQVKRRDGGVCPF